MPSSSSPALAQARADWLAGDRDAWTRYLACVRQLAEPRPAAPAGRPRTARRVARSRRVRGQA